jgi:hypothetical protein
VYHGWYNEHHMSTGFAGVSLFVRLLFVLHSYVRIFVLRKRFIKVINSEMTTCTFKSQGTLLRKGSSSAPRSFGRHHRVPAAYVRRLHARVLNK